MTLIAGRAADSHVVNTFTHVFNREQRSVNAKKL